MYDLTLDYDCDLGSWDNDDILKWVSDLLRARALTKEQLKDFLRELKDDDRDVNITHSDIEEALGEYMEDGLIDPDEVVGFVSQQEDIYLKCVELREFKERSLTKLNDLSSIQKRVQGHKDSRNYNESYVLDRGVLDRIRLRFVSVTPTLYRFKFVCELAVREVDKGDVRPPPAGETHMSEFSEWSPWVSVIKRKILIVDILPQQNRAVCRYNPMPQNLAHDLLKSARGAVSRILDLNITDWDIYDFTHLLEPTRAAALNIRSKKIEGGMGGERFLFEGGDDYYDVVNGNTLFHGLQKKATVQIPVYSVQAIWHTLPDEVKVKELKTFLNGEKGLILFSTLGRNPEEAVKYVLRQINETP